MLQGCVCLYREVNWQLGVDLLPDGTSSSLLFVTGIPHWDHIVSIHLVHRDGQPVPCLWRDTDYSCKHVRQDACWFWSRF